MVFGLCSPNQISQNKILYIYLKKKKNYKNSRNSEKMTGFSYFM